MIKAHLEHLRDHNQDEYLQEAIEYLKENDMEVPIDEPAKTECAADAPLPCGCPGSAVQDLRGEVTCSEEPQPSQKIASPLRHWPVQLMLVPPSAPYLKDADLLIASDCVPCAYPNFHNDMLKDKIVLISCPKFDNMDFYKKKLTEIFKDNNIKSVTAAIMEVPCCFGLVNLVKSAIASSGKDIPLNEVTISVKGEIMDN